MAAVVLLVALLVFAGFQMHLRDRARRDLIDLASRLAETGQPIPPALLDKMMGEVGTAAIPRWVISLVLLLPVVPLAFTASAFNYGDYVLVVRIGAALTAAGFVIAAVLVAVRSSRNT